MRQVLSCPTILTPRVAVVKEKNRRASAELFRSPAVYTCMLKPTFRVTDTHGIVATLEGDAWVDVAGFKCSEEDATSLLAFARGYVSSEGLVFMGRRCTFPRLIMVYEDA